MTLTDVPEAIKPQLKPCFCGSSDLFAFRGYEPEDPTKEFDYRTNRVCCGFGCCVCRVEAPYTDETITVEAIAMWNKLVSAELRPGPDINDRLNQCPICKTRDHISQYVVQYSTPIECTNHVKCRKCGLQSPLSPVSEGRHVINWNHLARIKF